MKKLVIFIGVLFLFLSFLSATSYAFGPDVEIVSSSKTVMTFDTDYNLNSGDIFVAVRLYGENKFKLYRSSDHGLSWSLLTEISTSCGSGTSANYPVNVRLIYSEKFNKLFLFYFASDGKLCIKRIRPSDGLVLTTTRLTSVSIVVDSIASYSLVTAQNLKTGTLYAYFREGKDPGDESFLCQSDDGFIWHCSNKSSWGKGGSIYQSLAYGPPNNLWVAYSTLIFSTSSHPSSSDLEIAIKNLGNPSYTKKRITNNSYMDVFPVVVQSNRDSGTVWIFFKQKRSGADYLKYAYSSDGGNTWHIHYLCNGIPNDAKFYKGYGNGYVDIVYIGADGYLYWAWAYDAHPTNWNGRQKISDQMVTTTYHRFAKVVYSPGAPAPGGGAVFSYYGGKGLYFDAPWITASSNHNPTISSFSADPLSGEAPLDVTFSWNISDPDGDILTCKLDVNNDGTYDYTINNCDSGSTQQHTFDTSGTYTVKLRVEDDKGGYSEDQVVVTVNATPQGEPVPSSPEFRTISPDQSWVSFGSDINDGLLTKGEEISLVINVPKYQGPVDLYVAVVIPGGTLLLVNSDNQFVVFNGTIPAFRTNTIGDDRVVFFENVPVLNPITHQCIIPEGTYYVYTLVLPAGVDIFSVDWQHDPYLLEYYSFRVNCE